MTISDSLTNRKRTLLSLTLAVLVVVVVGGGAAVAVLHILAIIVVIEKCDGIGDVDGCNGFNKCVGGGAGAITL
ncbi:Hypothetical predicted protein [Octopus vulgaris]|uniref:Transmembrane protein n=1 Tax=Octopus vulgaris TaxID=6645 RepID=A0AA36FJ30_OCTVU|nr:Hypothetical predicted protein [Octopus vulgaris]